MASLGQSAIGALMQGYEFGERMDDRQRAREQQDRQQARQEKLDARRDEQFQMNRERHAASMEAMQYKFQRQKAKDAMSGLVYAMQHHQQVSPEMAGEVNEATGGALLKAWGNVRTPRQQQAAQTLQSLLNPQSGVSLNDPRVIAAANISLKPELLEGVGQKAKVNGKTITIKRKFINGLTPSPNGQGVMVDLGVIGVDEDGHEVKYTAPVTKGRGTKEDALVADIPLDAAMKKIQGLNGFSRMLQSNPQLQAAMEQYAASLGIELTPDQGVAFKEIKSGDELLTYAVGDDGKRTLIARAPRFKPDTGGGGSKNAQYSLAASSLARLFNTQLDANGNAVFGDDTTRDDYNEALSLAGGYIDDGMNPLKAISKAYRAAADYTVPDAANDQISDRADAQIKHLDQSGKSKSKSILGLYHYDKTYGGKDEAHAKALLMDAYRSYYKDHGKLPQGFVTPPWAEQPAKGKPGAGLAAETHGVKRPPAPVEVPQAEQASAGGLQVQPPPGQPWVPPPVTPEPPQPQDTASLARSAVSKAAQGQPLSAAEKQAVIEQANQAIAAGKDPNVIRQRLQQLGISVTGAN